MCSSNLFTSQPHWLNCPEKRAIHLLRDVPRGQERPWKVCFLYRPRSAAACLDAAAAAGWNRRLIVLRPRDTAPPHVNMLHLSFPAPRTQVWRRCRKRHVGEQRRLKILKKVAFRRNVRRALCASISKWAVSKLQHEASTTGARKEESGVTFLRQWPSHRQTKGPTCPEGRVSNECFYSFSALSHSFSRSAGRHAVSASHLKSHSGTLLPATGTERCSCFWEYDIINWLWLLNKYWPVVQYLSFIWK